jgi:hypothetical protein
MKTTTKKTTRYIFNYLKNNKKITKTKTLNLMFCDKDLNILNSFIPFLQLKTIIKIEILKLNSYNIVYKIKDITIKDKEIKDFFEYYKKTLLEEKNIVYKVDFETFKSFCLKQYKEKFLNLDIHFQDVKNENLNIFYNEILNFEDF